VVKVSWHKAASSARTPERLANEKRRMDTRKTSAQQTYFDRVRLSSAVQSRRAECNRSLPAPAPCSKQRLVISYLISNKLHHVVSCWSPCRPGQRSVISYTRYVHHLCKAAFTPENNATQEEARYVATSVFRPNSLRRCRVKPTVPMQQFTRYTWQHNVKSVCEI